MQCATPQMSPAAIPSDAKLLSLADAEELASSLKRITVRSEDALVHGDAQEGIAQVERWVESYRRGLAAAYKISSSGVEMLKKTREQLALTLEERLRLEDEGGNPPTKEQSAINEELSAALCRIDEILPLIEHTFQSENAGDSTPTTPTEATHG